MSETSFRTTRTVLQDALLELLERKPLDRVSVADIIKVAHVNRSTFYYYYQTKEAVIEDVLLRAKSLTRQFFPAVSASEQELLKWFDDYTRAIEENGPFFLALVNGRLFQKASSFDDESMVEAVRLMTPDVIPPECDAETFVLARSLAINWVVESWIRSGFQTPRKEIVRLTWGLFKPNSKLKV